MTDAELDRRLAKLSLRQRAIIAASAMSIPQGQRRAFELSTAANLTGDADDEAVMLAAHYAMIRLEMCSSGNLD